MEMLPALSHVLMACTGQLCLYLLLTKLLQRLETDKLSKKKTQTNTQM